MDSIARVRKKKYIILLNGCFREGPGVNLDRKKMGQWAFGVGFSAVLFYFALRGTDISHIARLLRNTNLIQVAAAMLFLFLSFWVRAWRWRYLLLSLKPVPVMPLFRSTMLGFMGNYLLPFTLGN